MSRLNKVVAIMFVAMWLPVTLHCKIENLPGLAFLHCPTDTPANSDCNGDGCQDVESGCYKVEDNQTLTSAVVMSDVLLSAVLALEDPQPDTVLVSSATASPPELPKCWQFVLRTASPPRAPSIAS